MLEEEYEQRLRLEGELNALKSREQPKPEEKQPDLPELPDPAKYTDQKEFLEAYAAAVEKRTEVKVTAAQAKAKAEADAREAQTQMEAKVAKATADHPDFVEVMERADKRTRAAIPSHIKAAFYESDWGAHLAYHLAADPAEERRIFGLPVARALLELGKIEDMFVRKTKPADTTALAPPPETKQIPAPIARLGESAGVITVDLSQPMPFKDYLKYRTEENRAKRRR